VKVRHELHTFSREDLEAMAKTFARMRIVGPVLYGTVGAQSVRWNGDTIEVVSQVCLNDDPRVKDKANLV
jgi:hypothetical protein